MIYIDPIKDIGHSLLEVDKPNRYTGGEHGRLAKRDSPLQTLIAFPDLYEIGMSNQAFRIIYNGLNRIQGISCDRAFAPAPDFENLLKEKKLPLYGLDTGISLKSLDVLLFTLGYELGISGILSMLDVSGIPLRSADRSGDDPLIIIGGPAVSNPLPYSNFIDAFWIGEAEHGAYGGFFELAKEFLEIKQKGLGKKALLEKAIEHPSVWAVGKEKAIRAVNTLFSKPDDNFSVYPVASMKTVQHHGILEIMRGCPNNCRFCHAGYWYRPARQKSIETLIREAGAFINLGGYREISLSSLSSGDYCGIEELIDSLNERYSKKHISFQLPSLKVSSFALSLLEKVSRTRKSGLTFAVETPLDFWQMSINKQVTEDSIVKILKEAKKNGWRMAKFYFMIGLPLPEIKGADNETIQEEIEIVNFINNISEKTSMRFNINVGIFVPKPHTPYQWAKQIDSSLAASKLEYIRSRLRGHKVSVSEPLISMIEGIFSRGNAGAGDLAEQSFRLGSRLDAWNEYISKEAWNNVLEENAKLAEEFLSAKDLETTLPWMPIISGVSASYLKKELENSNVSVMSPGCKEVCVRRCGACKGQGTGDTNKVEKGSMALARPESIGNGDTYRVLFCFTKEGSAVFHGHLSLIEIFSMAMTRAEIEVRYTEGFNPLAKLEIVAPLSVGISSSAEIAAADFDHTFPPDEFMEKMNVNLPQGIKITRAECFRIEHGSKKHSLSSLLWGFAYSGSDNEIVYMPAKEEKEFRKKYIESGKTVFSLRRAGVFSKNILPSPANPWLSYFDALRHIFTADKI